MTLPRDFLSEVELELEQARKHLGYDRARVTALQELHALAAGVAADLNRQITVFDLVRSANELADRERRVYLVRQMRAPTKNE